MEPEGKDDVVLEKKKEHPTAYKCGEPICVIFNTIVDEAFGFDPEDVDDHRTNYTRLPMRCLNADETAALREWCTHPYYPCYRRQMDEECDLNEPTRRTTDTDESFAKRVKARRDKERAVGLIKRIHEVIKRGECIEVDAFIGRHDIELAVELVELMD